MKRERNSPLTEVNGLFLNVQITGLLRLVVGFQSTTILIITYFRLAEKIGCESAACWPLSYPFGWASDGNAIAKGWVESPALAKELT